MHQCSYAHGHLCTHARMYPQCTRAPGRIRTCRSSNTASPWSTGSSPARHARATSAHSAAPLPITLRRLRQRGKAGRLAAGTSQRRSAFRTRPFNCVTEERVSAKPGRVLQVSGAVLEAVPAAPGSGQRIRLRGAARDPRRLPTASGPAGLRWPGGAPCAPSRTPPCLCKRCHQASRRPGCVGAAATRAGGEAQGEAPRRPEATASKCGVQFGSPRQPASKPWQTPANTAPVPKLTGGGVSRFLTHMYVCICMCMRMCSLWLCKGLGVRVFPRSESRQLTIASIVWDGRNE